MKAAVKDSLAKIGGWLHGQGRRRGLTSLNRNLDEQGLITEESRQMPAAGQQQTTDNRIIIKSVPAKSSSLDKQQESFNQLVQQLQGINNHLSRQVSQHAELMSRIDELPGLLGNFPEVLKDQKQVINGLIEQFKGAALKEQQFTDVVEKIPQETAKQTDALVNIDHQLAAAAETDVALGENFNRFCDTLDNLEQTIGGQRDSIMQMSKTFAAGDRYLKYLVSKQNKRFMWIFITAIGVCVLAISTLAIIIAMVME